MEKIVCNNGDIIFTNGFEVEGATLFYSQEASNGNGWHRFYISNINGEILVYNSDKGWTGFWSNDVGLTFSEFFKTDESDEANYYLDIDKDDYFSFPFEDLIIEWDNEDPFLAATIPMHDAYCEKRVVLKIDGAATYEITTQRVIKDIDICFNCYYIGSACGEIWWVERSEDIEDLTYPELLLLKEELNYNTSDFNFVTNIEIEDYIIVDEIARCIVSLECDNWTNCLYEDLI